MLKLELVLSLRGRVLARIPIAETLSAVDRAHTAEIYGADSAVVIPRRAPVAPTRAEPPIPEDVDTWCDARAIDAYLRDAIRSVHAAEPWRLLRDVARDLRECRATFCARRIAARRRVAR